jgi:acetyl-CoA acetyltransferase
MTSAFERPAFADRTAISGVGYTAFSKQSGRSVLSLAVEASSRALADAGVPAAEVDGIVSYSLFNDSVSCQAVATGLAAPELAYAVDMNSGGVSPGLAVMNAAMAVATGVAHTVLVFRALNGRSGVRIGQTRFEAPTAQYRYPIGFSAYPYYMAMLARAYMDETGATEEDLGAVVMAQRKYAALNTRAMRRSEISLDEYLADRFIVEPFRTLDCTSEVDGGCAVLVTSLERARTLAVDPAVIKGAAWGTGFRSGLDIADLHLWPDYATNAMHVLRSRLWKSSGMRPSDMDFAEIYDCFSSTVLIGLEGLGLVGKGDAPAFVRSGQTGFDGQLPVNTHGGLLNEGYLHGMNTLAEGVLQIQGRCGSRQVAGANAGVVTSGAMADGSALVLARDGT